VVPVLAVASFFVHGRIVATSQYELAARTAQRARANVLRVQLDEETGLRGFTSTGDRVYLDPYTKALARSPDAFARLARAVQGVALPDAEPLVENERRDNATWIASVARPLLITPVHSPRAIAIQRAGRSLVDDFRTDDARLQTMLDATAASAYERADREISLILALNLVVLSVLVVAALGFGFSQARAARKAFEARVLYENEKRIADALQEAFLQKTLPLTPGVGLHATYVPASQEAQVGGDWYDAFALPDNRILFSIGDVAGHGLDAAVMMNRARQAIVSAALHENDPAIVLARANGSLLVQDSRMVTAICGYLDPTSRKIVYATAGHPAPAMARRDGTAEFMAQAGLPLGIAPDARYTAFEAVADPGALMVLYTDGVLEHKRDVIAGQARLLEAARRAVGSSDPALTIEQYVFEGSRPTDDVAILAISFAEVGGETDGASLSALQLNRWRVLAEPVETLHANGAADKAPIENVDSNPVAVSNVPAVGRNDGESARVGRRTG
jgi:serine phosphatase RsbU (regulator of sigma subunit)/CHASE3 domain sensor protein